MLLNKTGLKPEPEKKNKKTVEPKIYSLCLASSINYFSYSAQYVVTSNNTNRTVITLLLSHNYQTLTFTIIHFTTPIIDVANSQPVILWGLFTPREEYLYLVLVI